jgi:hypothetical protein
MYIKIIKKQLVVLPDEKQFNRLYNAVWESYQRLKLSPIKGSANSRAVLQ